MEDDHEFEQLVRENEFIVEREVRPGYYIARRKGRIMTHYLGTIKIIGKKAKADVVKALQYITLPDKIYATFVRKIKVDGIDIYEYHFLMLQNNLLYDLSLFGDKQHSNTSKFLAALGIYSMWTKEECANTTFSTKKRANKKTKQSSRSSDEVLLAKIVKSIPGIDKEINSFKITRHSKKGVSLMVSDTWHLLAPKDKDTLITLKGYIKGHAIESEISKLSKEEIGSTTKGLSQEDVVMQLINALSEKIIKEAKRKGLKSKVVDYPTPQKGMGGTVAYTIMKFYKEQAALWMSVGIIYNGEDLYVVYENTDSRDGKYIKFFTRLMSESLRAK